MRITLTVRRRIQCGWQCGWRRGFGLPDVGHCGNQSNASSDAGACEPNAEPTYEPARAVRGHGGGKRLALGPDGTGKIRVFEGVEALH